MSAVASAASESERSLPPVMLTMTPFAPSIEESSSSGFETARWAASTARFSPWPTPVPITAWPIPFITARTSAKSRLIWPGTVMMSEMPCTAWLQHVVGHAEGLG